MAPDWYRVTSSDGDADPAGVERLTAAWPDAPTLNLDALADLLDVARQQVTTYATAPDEAGGYDPDTATRLVVAQLRQAVNLWNASRVDGAGDIGVDQYTFTPRPLDKTIRQIIRPTGGFSVAL